MQVVLRQEFPLGRFHATPWRVNPFDDPHGEWPPSPWRLVRTVVARWYQWVREASALPDPCQLDHLIAALCTSTYAFHLPRNARRGRPLRQYQPTEFELDPPNFKAFEAEFAAPPVGISDDVRKRVQAAGARTWQLRESKLIVRVGKAKHKKEAEKVLGKPLEDWRGLFPDAGFRAYSKSLAQDNYWCVPTSEGSAVWWFLEGDRWSNLLLEILDRCLERITYFGRVEGFTHIRRAFGTPPRPNCELKERRFPATVPVLVPCTDATRADIERVTDDPNTAGRPIPPGARVMYALRPARPPAREKSLVRVVRPDCRLLQFAIGWNVAPEPRAIARLTARFRGTVIRELVRIKTGNSKATWSHAPAEIRETISDMTGKDSHGKPLTGPHRHTEFLGWFEDGVATRLLVWRDGRPFDEDEHTAILKAGSRELSWAAAGPDAEAWKVKLVPLDRAVPPPPGFDGVPSLTWQSITPYVPPRHHLRGGRPRSRESLAAQIRRELALRGFSLSEDVQVEQIGDAAWVAAHVPRKEAKKRSALGDRRGYWCRLTFATPVKGPLRLGHSSSFGLGVFRPVLSESAPAGVVSRVG